VKQIYGDEFGETILFAKDPNPENFAKEPNNCFVHENIDSVSINVTRNLKADGMTIRVSYTPEGVKQNGGGYTQGHKPDFSSFKGFPDKVFGGNTGNQTPNATASLDNLRTLSSFKDDEAYMIEYKFKAYRTEDGKEFDLVEFKYEKTIDCSIWFEYECGFDGDMLKRFDLRKGIMQSVDHGRDADTNLAIVNKSISALFGQDIQFQKSDFNDKGTARIDIEKQLGEKNVYIVLLCKTDGQAWWSVVGKNYLF